MTTRVNKLSGRYLIEVVLIDAHTARVLKRVDSSTQKRDLLDVARRLGHDVVAPATTSPLLVGGLVTAGAGAVLAVAGGLGVWLAEGAVQGENVSGADKELGFNSRGPLLGVAVVGAIVVVIGVATAIAGGLE